jgi:CheY-like chemotaxis protein
VRSTPGQGSTFFAVWPRTPRRAAGPGPSPVDHADIVAAGQPRVFVVEDDPNDRAWLVGTLGRAGCAVESVATGREAVARCRMQRFDAITLDLLLPDTSGRQLLEALRSEGANRDTPVIVVTVIAEKGIATGFPIHDMLAKPVTGEELLASLTRARVRPDAARPILVVDDNRENLKLAEATLQQLGYRAVCHASARAALRAAQREAPGAIVLDLVMPDLDGFQFLRRLRRSAAGRRTPVIVWSAQALTPAQRRQLQASAQTIVSKSSRATALITEPRAHVPVVPRPAAAMGL